MTEEAAALRRITTDLAIEAFRAAEQKRYQLELKEHALRKRLNGVIDLDYYYAETEKVRLRYEQDREYARRRGLL